MKKHLVKRVEDVDEVSNIGLFKYLMNTQRYSLVVLVVGFELSLYPAATEFSNRILDETDESN